jgi:hypothetical protein
MVVAGPSTDVPESTCSHQAISVRPALVRIVMVPAEEEAVRDALETA